ncbi:MAG: DUF805 domain-containing protein [Sphingopyxis sp.]|nr:DUF805 domain-containing protein [Sphingopyxis sp.]
MEEMLTAWKKYADFSGRSRRREFWMFYLGFIIVYIILAIIDGIIGTNGILAGIFALAALIPQIACAVRRMHDQDKSGWFVLLFLIPLVGLIFMCIEGTRGPNQYGPDPKGAGGADVFS